MKKIFKYFYHIFDRGQKKRMVILLAMMIIGAVFETVGLALVMPFISLVMDSSEIHKNPLLEWIYNVLNIKSTNDFIILAGITLIAVYIIKNVYIFFMYSIQYRFASNNKLRMSSRLLSIYLNKPYSFYLEKNSAEIIRNVNVDVSNVFTLLSTTLQFATELVTTVGMILVLLAVDTKMTIFIVLLLSVAVVIMKCIFAPIQRLTGVRVRESDARMIQWLNQSVHGIKDVKITESEKYFLNQYQSSGKVSAEATRKFNVVNTIPQLFLETVFIVGIISYILFVLAHGENTNVLIPRIAAFALAAVRLLPIANRINRYLGTITNLTPSLEVVYQEMYTEHNKVVADRKRSELKSREPLKDAIELNNVSFCYQNSDKMILDNASIKISVGETVGIIGPSGSGKTTLIDILLGLLKPMEGIVTADGKDIQSDMQGWLNRIGYVSQSLYLTEGSIKQNIAFGVPEGEVDDGRVWQVIEMARLDSFINELPNGVDTQIGEFGTRLSGGQKQRICIARALYYEPEILVMDEATSALDIETEHDVMESIENLSDKMTIIIIAHRLQTIEKCKKVYRVKNGKIISVRSTI
jgi:ABC-type multidrug transport system fused ATPase/permease subunit